MRRRFPMPLLLAALTACPADEARETVQSRPAGIFAPLGEPLPFASEAQRADFDRGRALAERIFTEAEGLGPRFSTVSCAGCHQKPVAGGTSGRYRNFYLIGTQAPGGFLPGPGGGVAHGYGFGDEGVRPPIDARLDRMAQRNALPLFGMGLVSELPDAVILANEDPLDADGDGISGRANWEAGVLGRFGRKAQTVDIEGFVRGPLKNHLGITTVPLTAGENARLPLRRALPGPFPGAGAGIIRQGQVAPPTKPLVDDDAVPDPELPADDLFALVSFTLLLAPPPPDAPTPATLRGSELFGSVGCAACHTPSLEGPRGEIPLYSDLLLHDLGPELADGIEMWFASGSEFRTQPLWGIAASAPYLNDGRADTLEEAIAWHGGEAAGARLRFDALQADEQRDLIAFLNSLGGADARSEGMLPPLAPVPEIDAPGGPLRALDATETARWLEGRRLFDRDMALSEGLGSPFFNGDSCRSCHSQPVIGGAGPLDVSVVRAGKWIGGTFFSPTTGSSILPRVSIPQVRRFEASYDEIERRKSPSLLGLGLVEQIPEAAILENADPDDADGDGIRGRASRLVDGRLGRFGWKADIPSLAEFVRDAHGNEMGFTLAAVEGASFGIGSDDDGIADPELEAAPLEEMTFFLQLLAPLQPAAAEEKGRAIFEQVGCAGCHRPSLAGVDLFSDLLLHDVAASNYRGIPTETSGGREFRTPPLWGLSRTGPWMHDGGAPTIEEAIYRHDGEALETRRRFEALPPADRLALLRFLDGL